MFRATRTQPTLRSFQRPSLRRSPRYSTSKNCSPTSTRIDCLRRYVKAAGMVAATARTVHRYFKTHLMGAGHNVAAESMLENHRPLPSRAKYLDHQATMVARVYRRMREFGSQQGMEVVAAVLLSTTAIPAPPPPPPITTTIATTMETTHSSLNMPTRTTLLIWSTSPI